MPAEMKVLNDQLGLLLARAQAATDSPDTLHVEDAAELVETIVADEISVDDRAWVMSHGTDVCFDAPAQKLLASVLQPGMKQTILQSAIDSATANKARADFVPLFKEATVIETQLKALARQVKTLQQNEFAAAKNPDLRASATAQRAECQSTEADIARAFHALREKADSLAKTTSSPALQQAYRRQSEKIQDRFVQVRAAHVAVEVALGGPERSGDAQGEVAFEKLAATYRSRLQHSVSEDVSYRGASEDVSALYSWSTSLQDDPLKKTANELFVEMKTFADATNLSIDTHFDHGSQRWVVTRSMTSKAQEATVRAVSDKLKANIASIIAAEQQIVEALSLRPISSEATSAIQSKSDADFDPTWRQLTELNERLERWLKAGPPPPGEVTR